MFSFFTIPSATTTIAEASAYSGPWFEALLPIAYVAIGVALGVGFILFLISIITGAFGKLVAHYQHRDDDYDSVAMYNRDHKV